MRGTAVSWFDVTIDADVIFEISVDAESRQEALEVAKKEAARRVRNFDALDFVWTEVRPADDQSTAKPR